MPNFLLWDRVESPFAGTVLVNGKPHRREFRRNPFTGQVVAIDSPLPSRLFITEFTKEADNDCHA